MSGRLLIRGGRLLDPRAGIDGPGDLLVVDGRVAAADGGPVEREIDATGRVVCPGFFDLRARLHLPGADAMGLARELRAAVAGGVTSVLLPPDTQPRVEEPAVAYFLAEHAARLGLARVLPVALLVRDGAAPALAPLGALQAAGCVAAAALDAPVDVLVLRRALEYAASHELPVLLPAQDPVLAGDGCLHEGATAVHLGLTGIPQAAEQLGIERALILARLTGARVHLCGVSSAAGAARIGAAVREGLAVSGDVAIANLCFDDGAAADYDSDFHLQPPLRSREDRLALVAAVRDGVLSLCSDHRPVDADHKQVPFARSLPGAATFETLLPAGLERVTAGELDLPALVAALSAVPAWLTARLPGAGGGLAPGARADLCIFDPDLEWSAPDAHWHSAGRNTPWRGRRLRGRVTHTLVAGRLVHELAGAAP